VRRGTGVHGKGPGKSFGSTAPGPQSTVSLVGVHPWLGVDLSR
jgi:hypothetical protein